MLDGTRSVQVLTGGFALPVALYGDFSPSDYESDYNDPRGPDRVMFAAPLLIGAEGDLNTDLVLEADPAFFRRQRPSLENVAGVVSVAVRELLAARCEDSLAYVTAGTCAVPCRCAMPCRLGMPIHVGTDVLRSRT